MQRVKVFGGAPETADVDVLGVPVGSGGIVGAALEALDGALDGAIARALASEALHGDEGKQCWIRAGSGGPDVLAIGVGDDATRPRECARRAAGLAVRAAARRRAGSVGCLMTETLAVEPACWAAAAEGLLLGAWSNDEFRSPEQRARRPVSPETGVVIGAPDLLKASGDEIEAAVSGAHLVAAAQNEARRLVNLPGNVATPSYLAEAATRLGESRGLAVQILGPEQLREAGFGALLAVARGSVQEPRFIVIEHAGNGGAPYVLVGKGVTFDAGGISLKPASGMEDMKYDMSGAAAVIGAMQAVADLALPHRVVGLVAATENLPSGDAFKPGDVIRGLSGKSIEVVNTDAEGRLILSDALTYATRYEPKAVVDLATLTGACVIALGHHAIGMMTDSDSLAAELEASGEASGDRVWRLPLWKAYRSQLDSHIADLKNTGGRSAGAITAGYFLKEFAEGMRWAHLDIAGTAWAEEDRGAQPKGATGVGVRLLVEWLRSRDED